MPLRFLPRLNEKSHSIQFKVLPKRTEIKMASTGARARSVDVSVEKLLEQEVEEISRSGEEKYKK